MFGKCIATLSLIVLAGSAAVWAGPAVSEARGLLLDTAGNPVAGAVLTFEPVGSGETTYSGKTNKKGRYFVAGMFNPQGDKWNVTIQVEEFVPVKMEVESRTVNKVLIGGEVWVTKLNPGSAIPAVTIKALGSARIDFELSTASEVAAALEAAAIAAAEAQGEGGSAAAAKQAGSWDQALTLASGGDLEGAIPLFREAIEEEPDDLERRETLAKVLYQAEKFEEAAVEARTAVDLDPTNVDLAMVLSSSQLAVGNLEGAKTTLQAAQELAPGELRVLRQLAYVAGQSGDRDAAIAAYEAVTEAAPTEAEGWVALGDLYASAGRLEASQAAYERVIELEPENAHQVFYNLGALIMNRPNRSDDDTRQAISAFRKAIELKPDYLQAHKQLAFALLGMGDRSEARAQLEEYVKLAPDAADAAQMQQLIKTLQ